MEKMSHREFLLWCRRIDQSWDKPSRSDWYLMQIAALLEMKLTNKAVETKDKKLKFHDDKEDVDIQELSQEELMQRAKEVSDARRAQLIAQSATKKKKG